MAVVENPPAALSRYVPPPEDGLMHCNLPGLFEVERSWLLDSESIYGDAVNLAPLMRLGDVKALGFLGFHKPLAETAAGAHDYVSVGFNHTRFHHSLLVARTAEFMLLNNGFSEEDVAHVIVAGLFHDIATPAGGDAVKAIDPSALDEEDHWRESLDAMSFKFLEKYGIDLDRLDDTIHNRGVLGQALDIADRIAYTALDTTRIHDNPAVRPFEYIYKDVRFDIENNEFYFENPGKLAAFLEARATNFSELYAHPVNRGADLTITKAIGNLYARDGSCKLTPDILRTLTDQELMRLVRESYNMPFLQPYNEHYRLVNLGPSVAMFGTAVELDVAQKVYENDPLFQVVGSEKSIDFNAGTLYKILDPITNRIVTYREFDSVDAARIEAIAQQPEPYQLYYYNVQEETPTTSFLLTVFS